MERARDAGLLVDEQVNSHRHSEPRVYTLPLLPSQILGVVSATRLKSTRGDWTVMDP